LPAKGFESININIQAMKRKSIRTLVLAFLLFFSLMTGAQGTGRPKVGLVLGGGGAKGAAEIGVLKVIDELGIPIDYIAGTSIGSIVGGLYAIGYKPEQLDSLFNTVNWLKMFALGEVGEMLEEKAGVADSIDFDNLPIPFACVAYDTRAHKEVVFRKGSLAWAMRASMAVPGVFKAVEKDSMILVDGGVMNNLPVDVVKAMGADIVIAIDLQQKKHKTRKKVESWILDELPGLDWLINRPDWKKYNENRAAADVCINPVLKDFGTTDFNSDDISTMIAIGYEEASKYRQELLAVKKQRLGN